MKCCHLLTAIWINWREYYAYEINQTEKDKYSMLSPTCGIQKIKCELMHTAKQKQTPIFRNKLVALLLGAGMLKVLD